MKKRGDRPITRTKHPEPSSESLDWVIWAAWADRVTFEEIEERTGYSEKEVILIMRRFLKRSSFRCWRKRVHTISIKNRKKFQHQRIKWRS
jgi:uncharacterized protein (TIGR03643 family)